MNTHTYAMGIDLGGTHIKGIVMDESGQILLQEHRDTRADRTEDPDGMRWKETVKATVESLRTTFSHEIHAAGMAAPGLANETNTAIACLPGRLQGLEGFVWGEYLGESPFSVINDAQAALIAESTYGAAAGIKMSL